MIRNIIEKLIVTGAELARDALGAAIRGEFEPLEQFGVKLSAAAIKERALALATDPANAGLSEQELNIKAIQELITGVER